MPLETPVGLVSGRCESKLPNQGLITGWSYGSGCAIHSGSPMIIIPGYLYMKSHAQPEIGEVIC